MATISPGRIYRADPQYLCYLPSLSKPCPSIFTDNFSNPSSGWLIDNNANYSMGYLNGEYQILIKQADWMAYDWEDFGVSDYRVEVDARPAGHLDDGVSLVFGGTDTGFYLFDVSNGRCSLWRNASGPWIWTALVNWTSSPAIHGGSQTNRLKVVCSGSNITLYVNDQMLITGSDRTYLGSGLGMAAEAYSANFDARFDNFNVYTGARISASTAAMSANSGVSFEGSGMNHGAGGLRP